MFLASVRSHSYLALSIVTALTACGPRHTAVAPATFAASSRAAFLEAAAATVPPARQILRIGWKAEDGRIELSGAGAVRLAPPDSLRLDIAAALGLGRSILIMTGDSVVAQPASAVDQILPDRFALWAALGIVRPPPGRNTYEMAQDGARTLWRVTDAAGRMTVFELDGGALSGVTRQEGERITSQLRLTRGASGEVTRASLLDTGRGFRLQVDVNGREPSEAFAPEIWRLRP
jgi:hypothetical protein